LPSARRSTGSTYRLPRPVGPSIETQVTKCMYMLIMSLGWWTSHLKWMSCCSRIWSQAGRTKPPFRKAVWAGRSWHARTVVYGPTIVRPAPRTTRLGTTASPNSRKEETRCSNTLPLCLQRPYPGEKRRPNGGEKTDEQTDRFGQACAASAAV
jgi:hypothetical protein